jgi:hypothetical protein
MEDQHDILPARRAHAHLVPGRRRRRPRPERLDVDVHIMDPVMGEQRKASPGRVRKRGRRLLERGPEPTERANQPVSGLA